MASNLYSKVDFRYPTAVFSYAAAKVAGISSEQGSRGTIYAATAPQLQGTGLGYYGPPYALSSLPFGGLLQTNRRPAWNPQAHDAYARERFFHDTLKVLEEVTGENVGRVLEDAVAMKV